MYSEDDFIQLLALQHFLFCQRQCALSYIEQIWDENLLTAEGGIMHENTHEEQFEKRDGMRIERGMPLRSLKLGLNGKADVVEFHKNKDGKWMPSPVEYKHGRSASGGKKTEAGEIPQEWNVFRLASVCEKIGSGATPKGGKESYHLSGISLIRSQNVLNKFFSNEYNNEWWFSVIDVCEVLTDSVDAGAYWRKLKQRLKEEGSEVVTFCHGLKLEALDGKKYETDCAVRTPLTNTLFFYKMDNGALWLKKRKTIKYIRWGKNLLSIRSLLLNSWK